MEPQNRWWIGLIIVIIIIAGIYLFIKARGASENGTEQEQVTESDETNRIAIETQEPNSLSVTVRSVSLDAPGFIAIHEDANGQSGADVAASNLLQEGTHSNVSVIASLLPGRTYWAMLHLDNGNGVFSETTDPIATDSNGDPVEVRFTVKAAATDANGQMQGEDLFKG